MGDLEERKQWRTPRLVASVWWCGDEVCDCTQPLVERITPNVDVGFPWIHRERLWEGRFLAHTDEYSRQEREELQYGPLRAACELFDVAVPDSITVEEATGGE